MAIKLTGFSNLMTELENVGERSSRNVKQALEDGANLLKDTIQDYAPVKFGGLQAEWDVFPNAYGGINGRTTYTVEIDPTALSRDPSSQKIVYVADYAERVHDLEWRQRGRGTIAKGPKAGPRFVDRAIDATEYEIDYNLQQAIDRAVG